MEMFQLLVRDFLSPHLYSSRNDEHNLRKSAHRLCPAAGFFNGQNLRFRNFHVGTSFGSYQQRLVTILQKCPADTQFDSPEAQLHYHRSPDPRLKCAPHRLPRPRLFSTWQASALAKAINTVKNDRYRGRCYLELAGSHTPRQPTIRTRQR